MSRCAQALRPNTNFSNQINPIPPVQPHRKKYSPSGSRQISSIIAPSHPLHEGRIAIVTNVGMGCGGRGSIGRVRCVRRAVIRERSQRAGRMTLSRTAKPCGPGTRGWCQAGGDSARPDRAWLDLQSAGDGGKTNSSPERARHKP